MRTLEGLRTGTAKRKNFFENIPMKKEETNAAKESARDYPIFDCSNGTMC